MLFEKHNIQAESGLYKIEFLKNSLLKASDENILSLLSEIASTQNDLSIDINNKNTICERWNDLVKCLALDGIVIKDEKLKTPIKLAPQSQI